MRKAISNDDSTGTTLAQPDEPQRTFAEMLGLDAELDWFKNPVYPDALRQWLNRTRKKIARLAQEDLERDIAATIAAAKLMQQELDRRTLAEKQRRLDIAARNIERSNLRIERETLKRLRGGRGFRN